MFTADGRDAELERVTTTAVDYEHLDIVFRVQWADPQRVCDSCLQLQGFTLDSILSGFSSTPDDVIRGEDSNMAVIPYTQFTSVSNLSALLYYRLVTTEAHTPFLGFRGTMIHKAILFHITLVSLLYFRVECCSDQSCCSK